MKIKSVLPLLLALGLTYALHTQFGSLPPIGKLLSPSHGFWQNAEAESSAGTQMEELKIPGLLAPVQVLYDEMAIPHIFAANDHDVYLAQGYLTAKDRLWQMEFQTHFAGGRISELVGAKGLESDRYQRRMGAVYGAEQFLKGMEADPKSKAAIEAYADGINAYINQLDERKLPLEYKLLNYRPEPWTPLKSALLLKNMAFVLASGTDELRMSNLLSKFGKDIMDDLFPNYPFEESPIIPEGTPLDFTPLPLPPAPKDFVGQGNAQVPLEKDPNLGSNNWAVSGKKTLSGAPILSNDPHLNLTLPSIWYHVQLVAPGLNVYGTTIPGSPGVIIGFNQDIAWGFTNVDADVLDWYQIKFKDASKSHYWHDGQWKPTKLRIETYQVKGQSEPEVDSIYFTHHGPVVYEAKDRPFNNNIPIGHAARWMAHDASQEVRALYMLNRAKNYDEYTQAIQYFAGPAQNFAFASKDGDIALWVNGRYPLKPKQMGKYLLDGTDPMADWKQDIPHEHKPHVKNPARGFVSSANQSSVDPSFPYYINWQQAPSERGRRINERLASMEKITVDSMFNLLNDNYNLRARKLLPILLPHLADAPKAWQPYLQELRRWDLVNTPNSIAATLFEQWVKALQDQIWNDDLIFDPKIPVARPAIDRLIHLLEKEPNAPWIDHKKTPEKEDLKAIVKRSFQANIDTLTKQHGPFGPAWNWSDHKDARISHLIPGMNALSRMHVKTGGGGSMVNAITTKTGPSMRLVVELPKNGKPKAYGIYPGGQSGNPGNPHYEDLIDPYLRGELKPLLYLNSPTENSPRIKKKMTLLN